MAEYTIKKLVLDDNKLILPSIQRKFVWNEEKICQLFDSIMRKYPIGQFLIWNVKADFINKDIISFYKFIHEYNENDNFINEPLNFANDEKAKDEYLAILDGQQRIQSFIIALNGSMTARKKFQKEYLYINLTGKPNDEEDYKYQFEFLTLKEKEQKENGIWFKVGDIFKIKEASEITAELNKYEFEEEADKDFARDTLTTLMMRINEDKNVINYYEIPDNFDVDEILDVFVRTNSGGVVLTKPDLLFSTIVSKWNDARDVFDEFLKEINNAGNSGRKYKFNIDFIMRTILYVLDKPIEMKVKNFKESIENIKEKWDNGIADAIRKTVKFLKEIGFYDDNITTYNAIMPIIYYIYNKGKMSKENKKELEKYFIVAQLKRLFGVASNSALNGTRNKLKNEKDFKFKCFSDIELVGNRTFRVNREDVEKWMNYEKGEKYTFMILTLLYPDVKVGEREFHQDHLHPASALKKMKQFKERKDKIANLQLLQGNENESKGDMSLEDWINAGNKVEYLPKKVSLKIEDFDEFMLAREEKIVDKLLEILKI